MERLYERLQQYGAGEYYGMHMPGHKRNTKLLDNHLPYDIDITEIYGFDDLHHAEGILKEAQERAARLYHAEETHFLVNGSTVGILSAILGLTERGDTILVSRNCHKSVYHAMYLNELNPLYIYPTYEEQVGFNGEIEADDVEEFLKRNPKIKAVMIVSPTYDGVVSDVKKIADVAHRYGVPLIVDEAHGAHLGFHTFFPENSNQCGADVVIHSVHKTMPAMTQTALIHLNGTIVNRDRIRMYLHMLQTSSPSYVLMASIDECMHLLEKKGAELFQAYVERLKGVRKELEKLRILRVVQTEHYDFSKIIVSVRHASISSVELEKCLREKYFLQMEMISGEYILAMTSVGDTLEGLNRFARALIEIDQTLEEKSVESIGFSLPRAQVCLRHTGRLMQNPGRYETWRDSIGEISMEYAYLYPPGIPIVVPGERITKDIVEYLERYEQLGFTVEGISVDNMIKVWINE